MSVQNPGNVAAATTDPAGTPPAAAPGATPAAAPVTTPAPAATETEQSFVGWTEPQINAYKQVAAEDKKHRLAAKEAREKADSMAKELAEYKKKDEEAATKKLEEEGQYKTIIAQKEAAAEAEVKKAKEHSLKVVMRAELVKAGADPDLEALLEKNGITIDEQFNVSGVDTAIEKLKATKPHYFTAAQAAAAAADPPAQGQVRNGLNTVPGTDKTYQEFANAGPTPPAAANTRQGANKLPDVSKMSKKEADEWFRNYKRGLPNK